MIKSIALASLLLATPALAQQPVPKNGTCPDGFQGSGSFCVPLHAGNRAIPKTGTCPEGWHSSGSSCVAYPDAKDAVPRAPGSTCPSGWHSSGGSCVAY